MRALGALLGLALLLPLAACVEAADPDDGAADAEMAEESEATDGGSSVDVLDLETEHLGDVEIAPTLSLTANAGGIDVVHSERWANCCPEFMVEAAVEGQTIALTYTEKQDCNCVCSWELRYHLDGVESGTWTVEVEGLSEEISVP